MYRGGAVNFLRQDMELVKITVLAKELGISHKTIYNWISDGRLKMEVRGYVDRLEAWAVHEHMQARKISFQRLMAKYGTERDKYGRFVQKKKDSE